MTFKHGARRFLNRVLARFDIHVIRRSELAVQNRNQLVERIGVNRILDVGAHQGDFVLDLVQAGWSGSADSFEPDQRSFVLLQKRAAKVEWWTAHQVAVSNVESKMDLYLARNEVSSSLRPMMAAHVNAEPNSEILGSMSVSTRRLDDLVEVLPTDRIFLKIDVQGFESEVLDGAVKTMPNVVMAQVELSFVPLYEGQSLWLEVVSTLVAHGFHLCGMILGFYDPDTGVLLQADGLFIRNTELAALAVI